MYWIIHDDGTLFIVIVVVVVNVLEVWHAGGPV
jgi:hypothetical protein